VVFCHLWLFWPSMISALIFSAANVLDSIMKSAVAKVIRTHAKDRIEFLQRSRVVWYKTKIPVAPAARCVNGNRKVARAARP
jgi:hypothetical protein